MMALSVADEYGVVVASNLQHTALVRRSRDGIIGHTWREWTPDDQRERADRYFQKCLAGEPIAFLRRFEMPDKTLISVHQQGFSFDDAGGRRLVFMSHRQTEMMSPHFHTDSFDVAEYIESITSELAQMAARHNMKNLGHILDVAASEAGEAAKFISQRRLKN